MKDLTQGSIAGHLVSLAVPTAAGMLFQTLYYFVDLYFVAGLGDAAVAGVSAAGNVMFIILALTQVLGVGTVALISHAVGRKDQQDANIVFNQSLLIAAICGVFALVAGYTLSVPYLRSVAADEATIMQGRDYL
jgi:Na+-driven multidrug efflux pump